MNSLELSKINFIFHSQDLKNIAMKLQTLNVELKMKEIIF
jgi:hypothetical protein